MSLIAFLFSTHLRIDQPTSMHLHFLTSDMENYLILHIMLVTCARKSMIFFFVTAWGYQQK